ncbi:hypothetical protein [Aquimarina pacifica]|uniref:hypothetical protein n=1 Tax=Aquimarina pacifica TaxID=1296415 RepID=UPI00126803C2|nr:hypothetical protein [Aquimarina pacifica]
MKTILKGVLFLVHTIVITVSCTSDDDKYYPNTVTVDGDRIELKGAYTRDYKERQEDYTFKYWHYLELFGGNIEYVNLEEMYNGTGFLFAAVLNTNSEKLEGGTYTFSAKDSPFTFSNAVYWTAFNPDRENPDPAFITSGTIKIVRSSEDAIHIDVTDTRGNRITGEYNLFIRGLY